MGEVWSSTKFIILDIESLFTYGEANLYQNVDLFQNIISATLDSLWKILFFKKEKLIFGVV